MQIETLAKYLAKLETITSRNQITIILAQLFKAAAATDIDKICYLVLGRLAPAYEGIEFNLAEKMIIKVLSQAYHRQPSQITKAYKKAGDLGTVTFELAPSHGKSLSVSQVYGLLRKIALTQGIGSQEGKINQLASLLSHLDRHSARYITRIPLGKLRLGFSDVTILDALSFMLVGDKSARSLIEAAYNITADIGKIAFFAKSHGLPGLKKMSAEPGTPIRPSLCERLPSADKIIEKLAPPFAVEAKLDGLRTQLHVFSKNGKRQVRIFSRGLENITHMFPDIVSEAQKLPVKTAIFDSEAIGFNPQTGKFIPFQETVQRKRKHGIAALASQIPMKVFVFDLLYINGKSTIDFPFNKRRVQLETILKRHQGNIQPNPQVLVSDRQAFLKFFQTAVKAGHEGVVAKKLTAVYQPGARGFHWVKYKPTTEKLDKTHQIKVLDTIDCLVMGYYPGRGKRAKFGIGGFLAGLYQPQKDAFYTLTKVGTGLTDDEWREMKSRCDKLATQNKPHQYQVHKNLTPPTWITPGLVVELQADEITKSPVHTAGTTKNQKGYALRFPRLVRFRDDKQPTQATTVSEIARLYKTQRH